MASDAIRYWVDKVGTIKFWSVLFASVPVIAIVIGAAATIAD